MNTLHTPKTAAKEIKRELNKRWPTVRFSVKSSHFAGGNSIGVSWNMGPTTDSVRAIADKYQEGHFDGMTDCYNYDSTLVAGENGEIKALGGAKYVQCQRDLLNQEEIDNYKLKWADPMRKDLWKEEKTFYHTVLKDLCNAMNITYKGQHTKLPEKFKVMGYRVRTQPNLGDLYHVLTNPVDFTNGYHGIKNQVCEDGHVISNMFEVY